MKKLLPKSEFVKNVLTLITGTTIAQAIPVIASLFIARLYSPDEVGAFAFILSLINILVVFATFRYELAIVLPKDEDESIQIFILGMFLNIVCVVILSFLLYVFSEHIISYVNFPQLKPYLYFIPIVVFFVALYQLLLYWNNRNKFFKKIAYSQINRNLIMSLFQILLYVFNLGGLMLGKLLGDICGICSFIYKGTLWVNIKKNISYEKQKNVFLKYISFFKYSSPNAMLNQGSNSLPIFMFPKLFGMEVTGYFSWSSRIILLPMSVVTNSVQQVFFQNISDLYNKGEYIHNEIKNTYKKLFYVGIIPFILMFFLAPAIFAFVFGEQWRVAGEYTRYLIPWLFIVFMNSPISSMVYVLNKQRTYLKLEIILFFLRLMAILLGYFLFNSSKYTVILFGVSGFLYQLYLFYYLNKIAILSSVEQSKY